MSNTQEYAGFWIRLVAFIIDAVILMFIGILLAFLHLNQQFLQTLIAAIYSIYFWVKQDGMTPGKKAMKIKVVRVDGKPIDWTTAIIRYVGYFVSAITLGIGFIWIGFDKEKQGFHDKIASTYVIKVKS